MRRHAAILVGCLAGVVGLAVAMAEGTVLGAPPGLHAPTGLQAPNGLNTLGAGFDGCALPKCGAGDMDCGAIAFEAAAACLQMGELRECETCGPALDTTFFQARGEGVVLYGAVGLSSQRHALRRLREATVSE